VTVTGNGGRGGRCAEFLLSLGIETGGVWAIACDTDGIDGTEDNAGAILTPDSMRRGADARALLAKHDSYGFFAALGDLVVTGPTRTNVNDYRAILVFQITDGTLRTSAHSPGSAPRRESPNG